MNSNSTKILLIDDDKDDAYLTQKVLRRISNLDITIESATSLTEAVEMIQAQDFDLVLLDLGLPECVGIETYQRFRDACVKEVPIIVLSGLSNEQVAQQALHEGAQDYLIKGEVNSDNLSRSIRYSLQRHTLRYELEEANILLQQKNDRLKQLYETAQQFVDNVSHEFRTPLTVIREFTSIVQDGLDGPVTQKQFDHLNKVLHRTDDLALMVDDMLDISKLEAGLLSIWRRPCRVDELFEGVSSILAGRAASKSIELETDVDSNLPAVYCDEEKVSRVIVNLVVNALKFTPKGGKVKLWAKASDDGSEVNIGISDTGTGISPENLSAIFERFQQLDNNLRSSTKGFGLGLNISKELVSLNLGQMSVESELGKGSTFSFTVPSSDAMGLFDRYINQASLQLLDNMSLSLIRTSIPAEQTGEAEVVDEFLQRAVRGCDLVIKMEEHSWAIVAQCPEQEIEDLVQRINSEWHDYLRNCPNTELPQILCEPISSWNASDDNSNFRAAFKVLCNTSEVDKQKSVLVVDDDPELNQCLGMRFEAAGFEVFSASDGQKGLAAIEEHSPDAIVLDVRMPNMDGMEMLKHMRSNQTTELTPVVMLSASVRDQHEALEAGANFFVPKPYQANAVLSAVEASMTKETVI